MPQIVDNYSIRYQDTCIGSYYKYSDGSACYSTSEYAFYGLEDAPIPDEWKKSEDAKGGIPRLEALLCDENRVKGQKRPVYRAGDFTLERIPQETDEKCWIFRLSAEKGEEGYSEKRYAVPHREGGKEIEGMNEWASWYCFNKMDDGTYQAELDEAWWWGGGHNDGGTIRTDIPEEWFDLPYDDFLERVVTLSAAAHYGFTAEELKAKEGLKAFFGFA